MLNRIILCAIFIAFFTTAGFAQNQTTGEYDKNEFYVGYSNQQVDNGNRRSLNGFEGSYTRNVHRYFGIRADFSVAKNSRTLNGSVFDPVNGTINIQQVNTRSVYNLLGGIQVKDNASTKRFKPFAYALVGVAVNRSRYSNLACTSTTSCPSTLPVPNNVTFSDTGIAGAFGGGLDIKITKRIDFRAIQVDYNPIYSNTRVDNNFRFGIGFVFH